MNGIQDSPRRHRDVSKMADFHSKSAMVDRSRGHSRTPPLLNPRPSEDDPGRHAGRSAAALRLGALADHALLGVSSQPGGARPAIRRCPFVGNGPQWEGRSVPHGAGLNRSWWTLSGQCDTVALVRRFSRDVQANRCPPRTTARWISGGITGSPQEPASKALPDITCVTAAPANGCNPA